MIPSPFRALRIGWPLLVALLPALALSQQKVPVGAELERLSAAHGFTVVGLAATGEAVGRAGPAELYPRLRQLLVDFNHIIVQAPGGGIDRVIILGEKAVHVPPPPPTTASGAPGNGHIELKTSRRGTQHAVQVSLEGEGGKRVSRELLVDTGADFVVLPASLLSALGIGADRLRPSEMQTANGKVQARIGSLPAIWLGQSRIENIRAAFLDDAKLGNSGLLGMSVLSRYTMTIDDKAGRLTLDAKGGGKPGAPGEVWPRARHQRARGLGRSREANPLRRVPQPPRRHQPSQLPGRCPRQLPRAASRCP
jgi:clan AA aspartic protease (TIGR02281 family)